MEDTKRNPIAHRHPPELQVRPVRMVKQAVAQGADRHAVVTRIVRQLGVGQKTLRNGVRQAAIAAAGQASPSGVTSSFLGGSRCGQIAPVPRTNLAPGPAGPRLETARVAVANSPERNPLGVPKMRVCPARGVPPCQLPWQPGAQGNVG